MAPTESTILTSFLLDPAALPTIIPLSVFTNYFPSTDRTSSAPEIRRLYRSLQQRRALLTDAVAANIDREVKNGAEQRRAIASARAQEKIENGMGNEEDEEVVIERVLFGPTSNLPTIRPKPHTLDTILPELETAVSDIEAEIQALEREADDLLREMKATVSGLSDLRYGRLANTDLKTEVLEGLGGLEGVCGKK